MEGLCDPYFLYLCTTKSDFFQLYLILDDTYLDFSFVLVTLSKGFSIMIMKALHSGITTDKKFSVLHLQRGSHPFVYFSERHTFLNAGAITGCRVDFW